MFLQGDWEGRMNMPEVPTEVELALFLLLVACRALVPLLYAPVTGSMHCPPLPATPYSPEEQRNVTQESPNFIYSWHWRIS
jgi:hypothetical protein